ncbi:GTP-binding protein Di-Ras1 isoform X2 [Pezoporus wallicus]|uniref:GTP-binding protein Di-Ras1 isoform X2 n=1 Tax=Pezoporus wallicus TaxID=35540 RepID=UPI00254E85ED|nr:GTP-binding protein Di-Ras1 isoform X2 [Pezoporus wallicus]XP_061330576.1 GTP-binding protein Di-Ras1 isoform X2 [Pezoporus flaviventris]
MKIVVAKVLCLLGICVLMLVGSLLPVKIIEADYEKAHRSKKVLALCNSFGGGVFLATCFNALLPAVREKQQQQQHPQGKMPEQSNDYRVVVFGAGGVGKSSLVLRFVKGTFRDTYIPTIEDTYRQVISCDKSVCTLQITDTTGSHQFPAMQRLSISKGHAFILVFSVTSKQSLEELKPIYQQIVQIKGSVESIPIMLVGNKCDETQREVESREGEAMAKEWKCAFMETSAKMNYNVKELFQELLNLEKRRNVSLTIDGKRSSKQKRTDKIKGKCSIM